MKTFYKILGLSLSAVLLFASCAKETTPYSPGQPAGNQNVYFSDENESTVILGLSDEGFSIFLTREDTGSSLTVPVTAWCNASGIISVPESVTFDAGNNIAVLNVKVSNMDPFTEYQMNLSIPEEYTQPYDEDLEGYPQCGFIFYKEDYELAATCMFYDYFWSEEEWEENIEYSPMLDTYRINPFPSGSPITFKWDQGENISYASNTKISTGFVHSSYGAVSATPTSVEYYEDYNEILFWFKWTVAAGSFGEYPEYVYDIQWVRN